MESLNKYRHKRNADTGYTYKEKMMLATMLAHTSDSYNKVEKGGGDVFSPAAVWNMNELLVYTSR